MMLVVGLYGQVAERPDAIGLKRQIQDATVLVLRYGVRDIAYEVQPVKTGDLKDSLPTGLVLYGWLLTVVHD
ncbi:hypothetical protein BN8_01869 [Fibrisoma limi BUZ 3]|uniref:Uncharacterized protein n=1 Tax=Fibrisoma limi BUZ 3 TaxID=1185876 RepID=I2GG10_9BACT|nr:hypothetical protein [Fibrisoma limi]CCH52835.1 hypothetical protein BN8_01869 [Fibrisoma limi BUZ 3]